MTIEIERKFLVKNLDFIKESFKKTNIIQGYLSKDPLRTVRVRIEDNMAFLTIKGKSSKDGITRLEIEKPISLKEAKILIKICLPDLIKKVRYMIKINDYIFYVDVFKEKNNGLIIAEIELDSIDSLYPVPYWLGEEVTGQTRYYNSQL
ncbi:MAG: CYTH domain-containing protein [Candidatus Marivariicella sp.]